MSQSSQNDASWGAGPSNARQMVRTMQIISFALMLSVIIFAGITLFLRLRPGAQPPAANPMFAYVAVAAVVMAIGMRSMLMSIVAQGVIKQRLKTKRLDELEPIDLYPAYLIQMIVGAAQIEGAAFFVLVSYMLDGQLWSMGLVVALLAMMAVSFPSMERVDAWADDQLRALRLNPPRPDTF